MLLEWMTQILMVKRVILRGSDAPDASLTMGLLLFSLLLTVSSASVMWNVTSVMYNVMLQIKITDGLPHMWEVGMGPIGDF